MVYDSNINIATMLTGTRSASASPYVPTPAALSTEPTICGRYENLHSPHMHDSPPIIRHPDHTVKM